MSRKRKVAGVLLLGAAACLAAESLLPPQRQISAQACLGAIDVYQATGSRLSGALGLRCRYTPSCSHYAEEAIAHYGTVGGAARTAGRLWRCSPWGGCGYDPAVEPGLALRQETPEDRRIRVDSDDKDRDQAMKEAKKKACGLAGAACAVAIVFSILALAVEVLILVWIYKDAKARGDQNAAIWLVLVFFTHLVGLIVYLLARPKGDLAPCGACHNRKMTTLVKCPHCGQESGAGGAAAI